MLLSSNVLEQGLVGTLVQFEGILMDNLEQARDEILAGTDTPVLQQ